MKKKHLKQAAMKLDAFVDENDEKFEKSMQEPKKMKTEAEVIGSKNEDKDFQKSLDDDDFFKTK